MNKLIVGISVTLILASFNVGASTAIPKGDLSTYTQSSVIAINDMIRGRDREILNCSTRSVDATATGAAVDTDFSINCVTNATEGSFDATGAQPSLTYVCTSQLNDGWRAVVEIDTNSDFTKFQSISISLERFENMNKSDLVAHPLVAKGWITHRMDFCD